MGTGKVLEEVEGREESQGEEATVVEEETSLAPAVPALEDVSQRKGTEVHLALRACKAQRVSEATLAWKVYRDRRGTEDNPAFKVPLD